MPLKLRNARAADLPLLNSLLGQDRGTSPSQSIRLQDRAIQRVVIAEHKDEILGFFSVTQHDDVTLAIDAFWQAPDNNSEDLVSLLLTRIDDFARSHSLRKVRYVPTHDSEENQLLQHGYALMPDDSSADVLVRELPQSVHRLKSVDLTLSKAPWIFEQANSAEIGEHFEDAKKRIPLLWNGRTLKLTNYNFSNGHFVGTCSETSFSAYLAWRDWGAPDLSVYNLFGSALLRSSDGALLFGVMSDRTATAGLIYPPGGNLDLNDLGHDNKIDVVGAIFRELREETGLTDKDVHVGDFLVAFDGPRISIAHVFDLEMDAETARSQIMKFAREADEEELSDIRIIRKPEDVTDDPAVISYAREYAGFLLS